MSLENENLLITCTEKDGVLNDVSVYSCFENFGSLRGVFFMKCAGNDAIFPDLATAQASANWIPYFTAVDDTKMVRVGSVGGIFTNFQYTGGDAKIEDLEGTPLRRKIRTGQNPDTVEIMALSPTSAFEEEMRRIAEFASATKGLKCWFVDDAGKCLGGINGFPIVVMDSKMADRGQAPATVSDKMMISIEINRKPTPEDLFDLTFPISDILPA